jgi:Ribbon-helix-helix protein, copG family
MRKTSIYLDDEIDIALSRRARAEGVPKAELIRAAMRSAAEGSIGIKPRAIGVFDGPEDLAERLDDYLGDAGFEG